jgi:DNA-binding LacI/PurR family transcriptional regulator
MNTVRQNFSFVASEAVKELMELLSGHSGREKVLPYQLVRMKYEDIIC